jgi:hypothetical protein
VSAKSTYFAGMKLRLKLIMCLLFAAFGLLKGQRVMEDNDYGRTASGQAGLSVVIDQQSPVIGCGQAVTLTATITGANGIAWLRDGEYIDGATTETYVANQSGVYTVIIVSLLCQLESAPVEVIILSPLNAQIQTPSGASACEGDAVTLVASGAGAGSLVIWQWYRDGLILPGADQEEYQATQAGSYTVVGNEGSVCASISAPVGVEIYPLPSVNLTWSGIPTVCEGDSLALIANIQDNQQISWYHDETLVVGAFANTLLASAAGEYHATVLQTTTGCEAMTASVYLEYLPQQTVSIVANGPTSFCAGSQVQLSIGEGTGAIEWLNNGAPIADSTSVVLSVFESGVYTARIIDGNGCREISNSIEVVVDALPDGALLVENNWPVLCGQDTLFITAASGNAYVWLLGDSILIGEESAVLQVSAPGSYSAQLTDAAGCVVFSQAIEVLSFEAPVVLLEPTGSVNICSGQTQLLDVQSSAALSYTWLLDGVEFLTDFMNALEVSQGGVWTVIIEDENGCTAQSEVLELTVLEVPTPVITAGELTSAGQLLLSDAAAGHQWFLNGETIPNATNSEYLATEDGIYSVVSIEDVCESEVSDGFEVVLGGVSALLTEGISAFPNPCSDQLRVVFGHTSGTGYTVYDASGRVVFSGVVAQMQTTIDVQSWSAGMYSISTDQGARAIFTVTR